MNTNSNAYTFIFAAIMVLVIGSTLAYTAISLQPIQQKNVEQEKMQSILATVGIETVREEAPQKYEEFIEKELVLNNKGEVLEGESAFDVDLASELDKPVDEQRFPLYIANIDGEKYYIIPLRGNGLWNAIWGYMSLEGDINTIAGTTFDHAGETPGLGAEITKEYFTQKFVDEKVFDENGNLVGVSVVKGYTDLNNKDDHKVDIISGATITSVGVSDMIQERLKHYLAYFKTLENFNVASK